MTATEDQFYSGFINTRYLLSLSLEQVNGQKMISGHLQNELILFKLQLNEEQEKLYRLENTPCWKDMTVPVEKCKEVDRV